MLAGLALVLWSTASATHLHLQGGELALGTVRTAESPLRSKISTHDAQTTSTAVTLHVNLIIQESIYSGVSGVSRKQEPVAVGLPLADAAHVTSTNQLGLGGASAGQFRVLGRWPSGNIQWLLIDTLADLSAGKVNDSIMLTSGSGDFGGPRLATEDGSQITVSTGPAVFVVRKKKFDLIDQAVVNNRVLINSGASPGLVLLGPSPGNTDCPCSTVYASSNDATSDARVEENGPVRAVVRATGQLEDSVGHAYMRYTVWLHFYKGKTRAKAVISLQNADYGPSNSFASAYKGFLSFEARLVPNLEPGRHFAFGTPHVPLNGSFHGAENAYLYQAYSDKMEYPDWLSPDIRSGPRSYVHRTFVERKGSHTTWTYGQEGYIVSQKDMRLAAAGRSEYAEGWADLSDSTGAGLEIGTYQMAAYWPKSLQFMNGGSEVRIGIWPQQSLFGSGDQAYYQAWPQYSIHTIYLDLHDSVLQNAAEEFEMLEYPLVARASSAYYNETKGFLYPITDPDRVDHYFQSLKIACCIKDLAAPHIYRNYNWRKPGAGNQAEMRWANLMLWLQRGHTARYLDAQHFYTFQAEQVFPRSDYDGASRFDWRDRPAPELGPTGMPDGIASANDNIGCDAGEAKCGRNWIDNAHAHWYGMIDYYFMTGDETIKDAIEDGASDVYGNPKVKVAQNGTYYNSRNVGEALMSDARLALFYNAVGDHAAADKALLAGTEVLEKQVWPDLNVSGFGSAPQGVSRTRGLHFGCCPPVQRFAMPFQEGILSEGLWEFLQAEGPDWPQRQLTFDLAYGVAKWTLSEAWRFNEHGVGCAAGTGLTYEIFIDRPNSSLDPSCTETAWFNFYNIAKYTGDGKRWTDQFAQYLQHINGKGTFYAEYGTIFQGAVINEVLEPEAMRLVDVPLQVDKLSADTYRLSWTVPAGAHEYRLKRSDRNIMDWLDFDPVTNRFGIDPSTNVPWFAAPDVNVSSPLIGGTTQTYEVTGVDPNVEWHFALKAYIQSK